MLNAIFYHSFQVTASRSLAGSEQNPRWLNGTGTGTIQDRGPEPQPPDFSDEEAEEDEVQGMNSDQINVDAADTTAIKVHLVCIVILVSLISIKSSLPALSY